MKEKQYDQVIICDIDECGCIYTILKDAIKYGLSVKIIKVGISTISLIQKQKS